MTLYLYEIFYFIGRFPSLFDLLMLVMLIDLVTIALMINLVTKYWAHDGGCSDYSPEDEASYAVYCKLNLCAFVFYGLYPPLKTLVDLSGGG